jgi:hypothetical protein
MRLSTRSYPHPVVGNQDDVPGCGFQANLEHSFDRDNLYLSFDLSCSSHEIQRLIEHGAARYVVHIECSNTLFRKAYCFDVPTFTLSLTLDDVCESVEVNIAICASKKITDYAPDGLHEDYGDSRFTVAAGDFLAVTETHVIDVFPTFEALGRVGSIMQIHCSTEAGDAPMSVVFESPKIQIILSQRDFKQYALSKTNPEALGLLMCAIVLPVLIEAVKQVITLDEEDIVDGKRWQKVLSGRIKSMGKHSAEAEPFILAQEILELPVKRALAAAVKLLENMS